eukprot:PLAT9028.2.p1 GENE.PLAT9028.2~~PLAT9028.2.p1  ORF type:complete len:1575 (+),score=825.94 PLAT9028.2:16-4740(+)
MFGALAWADDDDELDVLTAESLMEAATKSGSKLEAPPAPRSAYGFVGLRNQGATCYLNSLIQACFMTPEFRGGLFAIDPKLLGSEHYHPKKEKEEEEELPTKWVCATCTLENEADATECLVCGGVAKKPQTDFSAEEEDEEGGESEGKEGEGGSKRKRRPRTIPLELQRLFVRLLLSDRAAVSTMDLTTYGFKWENREGVVQHDVQELNRILFDAIDRSLVRTPGEKLIPRLYRGRQVNLIYCTRCRRVSEREEDFYDIVVPVKGARTLADSVASMLAYEVLEGDNAYFCDNCGKKTTARMGCKLRKLPPVLIVSLSRFDYDLRRDTRVKITDDLTLPLTMDMRPFIEGGAADPPLDGAVPPAAAALGECTVLPQELLAPATAAAALRRMQSAADEEHVYDLCSVIVHKGSAYRGHYYALIRDQLHEGGWQPPSFPDALRKVEHDLHSPMGVLLTLLSRAKRHDNGMRWLTFDQLGAQIKALISVSWNKRFRKRYSSMRHFLTKHSDHFLVHGDDVFLLETEEGITESALPALPVEPTGAAPLAGGAWSRGPSAAVTEEDDSGWTVVGDEAAAAKAAAAATAAAAADAVVADVVDDAGEGDDDAEDGGVAAAVAASASAAALAEAYDFPEACFDGPEFNAGADPRFGKWYSFNDENVSPVSVMNIIRAHGGEESAYMLVYRSRRLRGEPEPKPDGSKGDAAAPSLVRMRTDDFSVVPPPESLTASVERENKLLEDYRTLYEAKSHEMTLTVHAAGLYRVVDGVAIQRKLDGDASSCVRQLLLDRRMTLAELRQRIWEEFADVRDKAGMPTGSAAELAFHELRQKSDGFVHLYTPVGTADIPEAELQLLHPSAHVTHGMTLMCWNGVHIGGARVQPGTDSEPVRLAVSYLQDDGQDPLEFSLWLRRSNTLRDLKNALAERTGLASRCQLLHLLMPARGAARFKVEEVGEKYRAGRRSGRVIDQDLAALQLTSGYDLLLEERGAELKHKTLAAREAARRAKLVVLYVTDTIASAGNSHRLTVKATSQLEVVKQKIVDMVNAAAAAEGGGDGAAEEEAKDDSGASAAAVTLADCHLALVVRDSHVIISNEGQTLKALQIKDSSRLVLRAGPPPAPHELLLEFAVVTGNDPEAAGGGGSVSAFVDVTLDDRMSAKEVCKLLCVMAGLEGQDATHRVRYVDRDGTRRQLLKSGRTLKKDSVVHGDRLLLEEGSLPLKGHISLPIFLWQPPAVFDDGLDDLLHAESALRQRSLMLRMKQHDESSGDLSAAEAAEVEAEEAARPERRQLIMQAMMERRQSCLRPLPAVELNKKSRLEELELLCMQRLVEDEELAPLLQGKTLDHMWVRILTADCVPGHVCRDRTRNLKKNKINGTKRPLVIQLRDDTFRPGPSDVVFWLARRDPFEGRLDRVWPMEEAVMRTPAGGVPRLLSLKTQLAESLDFEEVHHVQLAKLYREKHRWTAWKEGLSSASTSSKPGRRKRKPRRRAASSDIRSAPYRFGDGDILAVVDLSTVGDAAADLSFDCVEQEVAREALEELAAARAAAKEAGKDYAPEMGISFGHDLDFTDDADFDADSDSDDD